MNLNSDSLTNLITSNKKLTEKIKWLDILTSENSILEVPKLTASSNLNLTTYHYPPSGADLVCSIMEKPLNVDSELIEIMLEITLLHSETFPLSVI